MESIKREILGILVFIAVIWLIFVLDRFLPFEQMALFPRRTSGLPGIIASPFLHKDLSHIISNTSPLFVLMLLLAGSRSNSGKVVFLLVLVSGGLLWIFGRSVPVVGASGLVFALFGFLLLSGFTERRPVAIGVSIFVAFSYGSTLFFGILPGQQGISWDGHLLGAVGGMMVAWFTRRRIADRA